MRNCFIQCNKEANMLDNAINKHFPNNKDIVLDFNTINRHLSTCGVCNKIMTLRQTLLPDNSTGIYLLNISI